MPIEKARLAAQRKLAAGREDLRKEREATLKDRYVAALRAARQSYLSYDDHPDHVRRTEGRKTRSAGGGAFRDPAQGVLRVRVGEADASGEP
jgi:hypothetical protein